MVADRTQFSEEGVGIRTTHGLGPGSTCLEDEWGPAEQAVGVSVGVGVIFGEAGLVNLEVYSSWRNNMRQAILVESLFNPIDIQVRWHLGENSVTRTDRTKV